MSRISPAEQKPRLETMAGSERVCMVTGSQRILSRVIACACKLTVSSRLCNLVFLRSYISEDIPQKDISDLLAPGASRQGQVYGVLPTSATCNPRPRN